ncbi:L-rhamnose mutarotase [Pseudocolwellia sp. AS88]|uniref:L-rhamnose mutarotase n=1 Tax=Pseudocolwellia sp. AS88 TaxID=3063958 RepID=UPI0026F18BD3|nr:L-rhamnose mutarotase [Pseudocolwellia sp. AS88]MDO7085512.1 L-rhamnose mutarotase [Pseudocolwellia sp. AS88]
MTIRHCFALDLKDTPELIAEYKRFHRPDGVWPEIIESIKGAGIEQLEIYLIANRLFMIMDVNEKFSFAAKEKADLNNEKVVAWEELMWTFQQKLPWAKGNEKWLLMENIFTL